ncbi:Methylmalonate-semialdehyde dehydrogenase [Mycena sanguinolenta]|uniref:Methylmalonate-semialdehyde dehydrogenase n=1 Tax=Mycena sanguinolenta TaxID=230812 RepID=A0A8H7D9Z8_9AGAR|nr:Methylmalonate-semialdehyde dehydrogenase [Mycena sanguinolenta]
MERHEFLGGTTKNFIDEFRESENDSEKWIDILDPKVTKIGLLSSDSFDRILEEFEAAVETVSNLKAFQTWTNVLKRQRFVLQYMIPILQGLIRQNQDTIAQAIELEQGKIVPIIKFPKLKYNEMQQTRRAMYSAACKSSSLRAACSAPTTLMGEKIEVSEDMDTETLKLPLGVCASIAPFNFPA